MKKTLKTTLMILGTAGIIATSIAIVARYVSKSLDAIYFEDSFMDF